jgi:hypothetical protein
VWPLVMEGGAAGPSSYSSCARTSHVNDSVPLHYILHASSRALRDNLRIRGAASAWFVPIAALTNNVVQNERACNCHGVNYWQPDIMHAEPGGRRASRAASRARVDRRGDHKHAGKGGAS